MKYSFEEQVQDVESDVALLRSALKNNLSGVKKELLMTILSKLFSAVMKVKSADEWRRLLRVTVETQFLCFVCGENKIITLWNANLELYRLRGYEFVEELR